jgi:hypothetical protein
VLSRSDWYKEREYFEIYDAVERVRDDNKKKVVAATIRGTSSNLELLPLLAQLHS